MRGLTPEAIARAVDGILYTYRPESGWTRSARESGQESREVSAVVTDSRQIVPGALFAAIRGQRVDGHRFIAQCAEAGAGAVLAEELPQEGLEIPVIITGSTLQALRDLAEFYLSVLDIPTVAVIGSVGKTSTKEMAAAVLSEKYRVLKTEGNFNNELGVPLTIFRLRDEDEMAVLEMGINHFGEMRRLAKIVRPDMVIMTNIGYSHMEYLGSQEGILQAKSEVFEYISEDGCAILNADDRYLAQLAQRDDFRHVLYGIGEGTEDLKKDIWADQIRPMGFSGTRFVIHTPDGAFEAEIPTPGLHMVVNALSAAAAGWAFHLDHEQIRKGLAGIKTLSGRLHLIDTGSFRIIDDCYNASPASMESALTILKEEGGRRVAILGDMGELGEKAPDLHAEVGSFAAEWSCADALFCVGEHSRHMAEAAKKEARDMEVMWFPDRSELIRRTEELIRPGDTILVKASHFMQFKEVVRALSHDKNY